MGCCYHVSVIPFKKNTLCKYLHNKDCTTKCFACKLFTCDAVKVKYKIKDIIYVDCFFNIIQKIILKATVLTSKEAIIKMLMIF